MSQKRIDGRKAFCQVVTPELGFARALSALALNGHLRLSFLAAMSNPRGTNCPLRLKEETRRLFHGTVPPGEFLAHQSREESVIGGSTDLEENIYAPQGKE